jgi:hypothetical protein
MPAKRLLQHYRHLADVDVLAYARLAPEAGVRRRLASPLMTATSGRVRARCEGSPAHSDGRKSTGKA